MDKENIIELLQMKFGKIIEINSDKRSRVRVSDTETGIESPWLDIITPFTGNNQGIYIDPVLNSEVIYILFSEESGFIYGQIYQSEQTLPGSENQLSLNIDDNNKIIIDKSAKTITAQLDNFTIKGNSQVILDSNTLIKIGENAASAILKGDEWQSLIGDLADSLLEHVHPDPVSGSSGVSPQMTTAIPIFKAGQSATLSTLSKVE